jgi:hypothetical protein
MKQTAVEFYSQEEIKLTLDFLENKITQLEYGIKKLRLVEQAKEMEKEQMIEFAKYTEFIDTDKSDMNKVIDFYLTLDGEEFVEETFKSE